MRGLSRQKKWSLGFVLTVVVAVNVFGAVAWPAPVHAQTDAAITSAFTAKWTWEKIGDALYGSVLASAVNGASYFMRKLAYDTARYVASGGKGQGALAFQKSAGDYIVDVGENALAEMIDQFGKPFGLDLCKPPDIRVQAYLQVSLRRMYSDEAGPQPNCTWDQLTSNWETLKDTGNLDGRDLVSQAFAVRRADQGDFGIALGLAAKVDRIQSQKQKGADSDYLAGQGFKPLVNLINGNIKTPAQVIQKETESVTGGKQTELSFNQLSGIYGSGALQIIPMAASVFLNTLTNDLLDKVLTEGILPDSSDGGSVIDAYGSAISRNYEFAQHAFAYLIASLPTQTASYDILSEYSSCPEDGKSANINNCIIDAQLRQALDRAKTDRPLTIGEALKQGFLDPSAQLISPYREADNTNKKVCYSGKNYCYSNIQKMRKVRILPLGFEVAALKSDPDQPWKLGDVVNNFENCERDKNGVAFPSTNKPFCHLIDPNWVLKVPAAQCQAQVIGSQLETTDGPNRREECADIPTCLAKDEKGNCIGFGYCTKEKNIWQLGAQSCEAQFNTCRTLVNTKDNSINSYLTRTLDYGQCTQESVGCRAYSTQKAGDNWVGGQAELHFNDQIKKYSCPAQAEGCGAFYEQLTASAKSTDITYLKKAPDYLSCYDINSSTPAIEWAKTDADLAYLSDRPAECKKFAGACVQSEVGCRNYRPTDGTPEVTGRIGANACDAQCVGYSAMKQEASTFEPEIFPQYFIPEQAVSCPEQFNSCSEFTNIDTAAAGGESLEYYSSIKYCEKPAADNSNIKTFYTWESKDGQGYVLKTHKLMPLKANDVAIIAGYGLGGDANAQFVAGSPAYASDSKEDLQKQIAICDKATYQKGLDDKNAADKADPDCRAFYDDAGQIYYRLAANTVTVDPSCHPLRKTESFLVEDLNLDVNSCDQKHGVMKDGKCQRCYNGGQYKDGACVYWAISRSGESTSCMGPQSNPGLYNGCRVYTGNQANNVYNVVPVMTFEPEGAGMDALAKAKTGWSSNPNNTLKVKPEALTSGYSLAVSENVLNYEFATDTLRTGDWYQLDFWAEGSPQNLRLSLFDGTSENVLTFDPILKKELLLTLGNEWKQYHVGPVQFTGNAAKVKLKFVRTQIANGPALGTYYVDNVQIRRIDKKLSLIKKSWRAKNNGNDVPLVCDSQPADPFPGEALGCRNFVDLTGASETIQPATGFEKLCRPDAAGCTPFFDTFNTPYEAKATAYNVWCAGAAGTCTLKAGAASAAVLGTCTVLPGETGCYIDSVTLPSDVLSLPAGAQTSSTIVIPADTASSTPIYLTDRPALTCDGVNDRNGADLLGCQKVALETQTVPVPGVNSGYTFSESLVRNDPSLYKEILCRADLVGCSEFRSGNDLVYARDPKLTGNKLCTYNKIPNAAGNTGWFLDDGTACYPDNIQAGGSFGLWSQKTANYKGFVGQCPATSNLCTELVDPADPTPAAPSGTPYYAILDDGFRNKSAECAGKVSLKEGCVLFDQTESPNKLFDSKATYADSVAKNYASVAPKTAPAANTNIILKVDRDRECSEWLACKTSMTVRDQNNQAKSLCYQYSACRKLDATGKCLDWVLTGTEAQTRLTEGAYVGRSTDWYGYDYTGYSLFNKYPVGALSYLQFENDPAAYLTYQIPDQILKEADAARCVEAGGKTKADGTACGEGGGRCVRGICAYKIDGAFDKSAKSLADVKSNLVAGICKSAPEKTGPFGMRTALDAFGQPLKLSSNPDKIRYNFVNKNSQYDGANVCQDTIDGSSCSCEYTKVEYKDGTTDYWPVDKKSKIPNGVCSAGELLVDNKTISSIGYPCEHNEDCGGSATGGMCSPKAKIGDRYGLRGFCLEYDLSRPFPQSQQNISGKLETSYPCLTWLPIETSASSFDLYNTSIEAGYSPAIDGAGIGGEMYCLAASKTAHYKDNQTRIGSVDTQAFGTIQEATTIFDVYFNGFYPEVNGKEAYYCDNDSGGNYVSLACQFSAQKMYKPIQTWAWFKKWGLSDTFGWLGGNNINVLSGDSAVVLRIEGGNSFDPFTLCNQGSGPAMDYCDAKGWIWNGTDGKYNRTPGILGTYEGLSANEKDVFSLAPSPNPLLNPGSRSEYGTLVHPPRFGYKNAAQSYAANPVIEVDKDFEFNTGNYLPGGKPLAAGQTYTPDPHLFVSAYEETLNLNDLAKVCFVPLLYTSGKVGASSNLAILNSDFCIDFAYPTSYRLVDEVADGSGSVFSKKSYMLEASGMDAATYVLDESSNLSEFAFTDYTKVFPGLNASQESVAQNPRNTISRRYVAVTSDNVTGNYVANTVGPNVIRIVHDAQKNKTSPVITTADDPFSFDASTLSSLTNKINFWAVGLDFNKDGEFLGYISRWYNQGQNGLKVAVVAILKNQCQQFGKVYDASGNNLTKTTNKAKTDVTWEHTQYNNLTLSGITHQTPIIPFGSTNLTAGDSVWTKRGYTYGVTSTAADWGLPFSCKEDRKFGGNVAWQSITLLTDDFCSGVKSIINASASYKEISKNDSVAAQDILKNWFAKIDIETFVGYDASSTPVYKPGTPPVDTSGTDPKPPGIFALNPFTCFGKPNGKCTVGDTNNFSINGRNGVLVDYNHDNHPDEDKNSDGHADPLIAKGSLTAVMQFFASADDNHMPLKRIKIDWQDGSSVISRDGLYKNHKPYCEPDDSGEKPTVGRCGSGPEDYTQATCALAPNVMADDCANVPKATGCTPTKNGRHFGDSSRACKQQYFEFTNEYNCSSSTAATLVSNLPGVVSAEAQARVLALGYKPDDKVCVFVPRVQVQDNWGWCNGMCVENDYKPDGSPKDSTKFEGCYDPSMNNEGLFPLGKILQCNKENPANGTDPWTYYKGKIIVTP